MSAGIQGALNGPALWPMLYDPGERTLVDLAGAQVKANNEKDWKGNLIFSYSCP